MLMKLFSNSSICAAFCLAFIGVGLLTAEEPKSGTVAVKVKDLSLQIPETWKVETPANKLRLAQFAIPASPKDMEPGELVVSFFGGDGGGIEPNLKRWIGQFSSEGRAAKFAKGTCPTGAYYVSDITGTFMKSAGGPFAGGKSTPMEGYRSLSIILVIADKGNYFLKLTGPDKTVKDAAEGLRKSFGGNASKETEYEPAF